MDASELQDFKENLEKGAKEEPMRPVAFTMSVLAVVLAITTVMGERTHADAIINQNLATDQWNDYQAHKIRSNDEQLVTSLMSVVTISDKDAAAKKVKAFTDQIKKSATEQNQLQAEATALQAKVTVGEAQSDRYDLGEVLLEIGLVIVSITLMTRSRVYWHVGLALSVLGVVAAASAFFIK
jgi:hypothetical protein